MKILLKTTILSFLLFFSLIELYCQTDPFSKTISISVNKKPLTEVLSEITSKTDIHFSYSSKKIPADSLISIQANNKPINEILDEILSSVGVEYVIVDNQVLIKPSKNPPDKNEDPNKNKQTLSGYLRDKSTGEVLIGATIYAKEIFKGTVTNAYGFYSLSLPKDKHTIVFSYLGYNDIVIPVNLLSNQEINIDLEDATNEIEAVIINSAEKENIVEKSQMSEVKLSPKALTYSPALNGEADIVKSLQGLPGIKSFGDGSTSFYVRGGNRDQNLILLDEAPIYNPSHLFGYFSAISPDAVKDISIYKGDFPAKFGGRLSSLIDIKTKDGNMNQFSGYGSIGLLTNNLSLEGPIWKDKISYLVSLRASHLNYLTKQIDPSVKIGFSDFNLKFNWKTNQKNRFFISTYAGKDFFNQGVNTALGGYGIEWGNNATSFRWNHIFSTRLFSNTTIYASQYEYTLLLNQNDDLYWTSNIGNLSLKSDFTWFHSPEHNFKFGFLFSGHAFNPGNVYQNKVLIDELPYTSTQYAKERTLYISSRHTLNDKFTLRLGLRGSFWANRGPSSIFLFDENHAVYDTITTELFEKSKGYYSLEPRVSLKYSIGENSSVKASYNRTVQHTHLLSNSISPFTTLETWLPSGPNIKPQKANQVALGYTLKLPKQKCTIVIESFYKKMYNQIDYEYQASMLLNPLVEGELRFGKASSYGLELLLEKKQGKYYGWLGYTYSRVIKITSGINGNNPYPAMYDRPHDFSILLNYKLNKRFILSGYFNISSGTTFSSPTSFYYYQGYQVPVYSKKNNDRLPVYKRLDVSANYNLNLSPKRYKHSLSASILNALAFKNPIMINFNKTIDENGNIIVPSNVVEKPNYISSQLYALGFMPTISYKFEF